MKFEKPLNILVLCNKPVFRINTNDHINAFQKHSQHHVYTFSQLKDIPDAINLDHFDVLVIHWSLYIIGTRYLTQDAKNKIINFKGLVVQFLQDEYRTVNQMVSEMKTLRVETLFTCVPKCEYDRIYPIENLRKVNCLTGYVPQQFLKIKVPPIKKRPTDVGYRGRIAGVACGSLALEKWKIVDDFANHASNHGLNLDLSYREEDRLYGKKWIHFLSNCKTVLGTESGTMFYDFTGEVEKNVNDYLKENPSIIYEDIAEELYEKFVKKHDNNGKLNQISPRCFEAAALRTPMILFEGEYSNILQARRHYMPLKKDYSNMDEIIDFIRDDKILQEYADRTYEEIALNPKHSHAHFMKEFDQVIEEEFLKRNKKKTDKRYRTITLAWFDLRYVFFQKLQRIFKIIKRGLTTRGMSFREAWNREEL